MATPDSEAIGIRRVELLGTPTVFVPKDVPKDVPKVSSVAKVPVVLVNIAHKCAFAFDEASPMTSLQGTLTTGIDPR